MSLPQLLMLDEPSLGLAPVIIEQMFSILQEIKSQGTLLLVEQNVFECLSLSHRGTCWRMAGSPSR